MTYVKAITLALFVIACYEICCVISEEQEDSWKTIDKRLHGTLSCVLAVAVYAGLAYIGWKVIDAACVAIAVVTAVGAAKELYDGANKSRHTPSHKDFIADVIGGIVGVLIAIIVQLFIYCWR